MNVIRASPHSESSQPYPAVCVPSLTRHHSFATGSPGTGAARPTAASSAGPRIRCLSASQRGEFSFVHVSVKLSP